LKGQDLETWSYELNDLCVRFEFMICALNNRTSDYELQLAMLERRVGDDERPLTVKEIREKWSLCFERLNSKSMNNGEGDA
jgi:hypothetical protein